jgi:hypothetical protein
MWMHVKMYVVFFLRLTWIRDVYEHEMLTTQEKWSSNISLGQQSLKEKEIIECKEVLFTWLVGKQYYIKRQ